MKIHEDVSAPPFVLVYILNLMHNAEKGGQCAYPQISGGKKTAYKEK